jgi:aspartyl protease family protein
VTPDAFLNPTFVMIALAAVVILLLSSRIPVIGTLIRVGITAALIGAVVLALGQRERFDPYFAGLTTRLGLSDQRVDGKEVRIRMSPDGHFWVRAKIDGVEQRLLVDSGATVTALSARTAGRAGLELRTEPFPVVLQTANGTIRPQTASVGELSFGTIVARDLPVVVSPAFGDMNVLGMNFLSRLKSWRVEDGWLILTPHHPQETTS